LEEFMSLWFLGEAQKECESVLFIWEGF